MGTGCAVAQVDGVSGGLEATPLMREDEGDVVWRKEGGR